MFISFISISKHLSLLILALASFSGVLEAHNFCYQLPPIDLAKQYVHQLPPIDLAKQHVYQLPPIDLAHQPAYQRPPIDIIR